MAGHRFYYGRFTFTAFGKIWTLNGFAYDTLYTGGSSAVFIQRVFP